MDLRQRQRLHDVLTFATTASIRRLLAFLERNQRKFRRLLAFLERTQRNLTDAEIHVLEDMISVSNYILDMWRLRRREYARHLGRTLAFHAWLTSTVPSVLGQRPYTVDSKNEAESGGGAGGGGLPAVDDFADSDEGSYISIEFISSTPAAP